MGRSTLVKSNAREGWALVTYRDRFYIVNAPMGIPEPMPAGKLFGPFRKTELALEAIRKEVEKENYENYLDSPKRGEE